MSSQQPPHHLPTNSMVQNDAMNLVFRLIRTENIKRKMMKLVLKETINVMKRWIWENGDIIFLFIQHEICANQEETLSFLIIKVLTRRVSMIVEKYKPFMEEEDLRDANDFIATLQVNEQLQEAKKANALPSHCPPQTPPKRTMRLRISVSVQPHEQI